MSTAGTSKGRKRKAGGTDDLLAGKQVKGVKASPRCTTAPLTLPPVGVIQFI